MKLNHTKIQYTIGAAALALAINSNVHPPLQVVSSTGFGASPYGVSAAKISRFEWPSLGMDKTIALGEALKSLPEQKVTLFCGGLNCQNLRTDIDDALQIAGWSSTFEDRPVDSESETGVFVGPPGEAAGHLIQTLKIATGIDARPVDVGNVTGLAVIIGKSEGK